MAGIFGSDATTVAADTAGAATEYVVTSRKITPVDRDGICARRRFRTSSGFRVPALVAGSKVRIRHRFGAAGTTSDTLVGDTGDLDLTAADTFCSGGEVNFRTAGASGSWTSFTTFDVPRGQTVNVIDNDSAASESAVHLGMVDGRPTLLCHNPDDLDFYCETDEGADSVPVKHQRGLVADTLDFNHAASPGGQALWIAKSVGEDHRDAFSFVTDDTGGDDDDTVAHMESEPSDVVVVFSLPAAELTTYTQVYYDEDGADDERLLADLTNLTGGADIVLHSDSGRKLIIRHDASPGTAGVAVNAVPSGGSCTFEYISPTTTSTSCPALPSVDQITPLRFDEDGDGFVADLDDLGLGGDFALVDLASGSRKMKVTDKEGTSDPAVYADPDGATADERFVFVSPTDTDGSQTTIGGGMDRLPMSTSTGTLDTTGDAYWTTTVEFSDGTSSSSIEVMYDDIHAMPLSQPA